MSAVTAPRRAPDQTRQKLLAAAFEEIHKSGFRAASLDAILESTGVTKGALYHHFGSKQELGYAVVDEVIRPFVEARWKPILNAANVIDAAISLCRELTRLRSDMTIRNGCPLNNLINEMSPVDEGFRNRLYDILNDWREGIMLAVDRGQQAGTVRKDAEPAAVAAFILGSLEGCAGLAKANQSREFLEAGMRGMTDYLEHMRA